MNYLNRVDLKNSLHREIMLQLAIVSSWTVDNVVSLLEDEHFLAQVEEAFGPGVDMDRFIKETKEIWIDENNLL